MSNKITSEQLMYFQNILEQTEYNNTNKYNHYWVNSKDDYMGNHISASSIEHSNLFLIKSLIAQMSGGGYWKGSKVSPEPVEILLNLQDYFIVDKIIKQQFSNITLENYISICNLYEFKEETKAEYYGNSKTYQVIEVDTKKLLQRLQDIGCDVSVKKLESLVDYYTKQDQPNNKKLKM